MFKPGDVVLARIQFTDTYEIKTRPAVVLFEEFGNVVVAGITSNPNMKGVFAHNKRGSGKRQRHKVELYIHDFTSDDLQNFVSIKPGKETHDI